MTFMRDLRTRFTSFVQQTLMGGARIPSFVQHIFDLLVNGGLLPPEVQLFVFFALDSLLFGLDIVSAPDGGVVNVVTLEVRLKSTAARAQLAVLLFTQPSSRGPHSYGVAG